MLKEIYAESKSRMAKTVEDLQRELSSIRTGRASLHLLDSIQVDYYGTLTPLNQVATLHVPEPRMITVQPWDPSQIQIIERAILASDLGITPSNDGKMIRIPIPPLTEERRYDLARHVGKVAEDHRTAIRQIRRDLNEKLKRLSKQKEISEDDEHRGLDQVQNITNENVGLIDDLAKQKEQEIMEV